MLKKFISYLDDILTLAGCACIVWGIAQIYVPAAWIAAGIAAIAWGWLFGKYNA